MDRGGAAVPFETQSANAILSVEKKCGGKAGENIMVESELGRGSTLTVTLPNQGLSK